MMANNQRDAFSRLQLRLNFPNNQRPQTVHEREIEMMEEDYYFTDGLASNGGSYYGPRSPGKKWSAFVIACIDLGFGCILMLLEGKILIQMLTDGIGNLLISGVTCSLILSMLWFCAAWKLLESAYLRKRIMERYQMAKFWRIVNICLLFVFIVASVLIALCLYGSCDLGLRAETMEILQSATFRALFIVFVVFSWVYRISVIWWVNKYINELYSELSIDSLPLQVL